jgi:hypothetical protein
LPRGPDSLRPGACAAPPNRGLGPANAGGLLKFGREAGGLKVGGAEGTVAWLGAWYGTAGVKDRAGGGADRGAGTLLKELGLSARAGGT